MDYRFVNIPYAISILNEAPKLEVKHYRIYHKEDVGFHITIKRSFETLEDLIDDYVCKLNIIAYNLWLFVIANMGYVILSFTVSSL